MKRSNVVLVLLLFFLLHTTGCVYLRLLKVKNQCARFDEHFVVEEQDGLSVIAKKPVLYEKDMLWLGFEPSSEEVMENETIWNLVFEKLYPSEKRENDDFNMTISFRFKNKQLETMHISDNYFVVLPKEFFVSILKAFGDSKIDKRKRTATAEAKSTKADIEVPVKPDVLRLLGNPYKSNEQSDAEILTYRYELKRAATTDNNKDKVYWVKLKFDKRTEMLLFTEGDLLFGTLKIDYSKMLSEPSAKEESQTIHNEPVAQARPRKQWTYDPHN